jgi:hypothetical protein
MMVYDCHIPPSYFLDEMQMYEVEPLIDKYNQDYRDRWEQTRFIAYVQASCAGAKISKPSDLIKFAWDEEKQKKPGRADIDKLKFEMMRSLRKVEDKLSENNKE